MENFQERCYQSVDGDPSLRDQSLATWLNLESIGHSAGVHCSTNSTAAGQEAIHLLELPSATYRYIAVQTSSRKENAILGGDSVRHDLPI